MCKEITNPKLIWILENINTFSVNSINDFIKNKDLDLELSCLLKYEISADLLNKLDNELLKAKVEAEGITKDQLVSGGMHQNRINELFEADNDIDVISVDEEFLFTSGSSPNAGAPADYGYDPTLLDRINSGRITVNELQEMLIDDSISVPFLRDVCGLDDKLIKRIENYSPQQMSPITLADLPPLKPDRTDFYFLGMPSAGKSCLIASLLSHWMRKGICNPEVSNPRGVQYFKVLAGGFSKGILPRNNPNTFIDYIEVTLNFMDSVSFLGLFSREKKYTIPINILDMAGEKFENVANMGHEYFTQHKEFLNNDNYKSLFFILDYTLDNEGEDAFAQSFSLMVVLNNLKDMGILEKTDSIFLVVTKADMFNVPKEKYYQYAEKYLNEYYGGFLENLETLHKEYNFEYEIIPYSIGKCIFGQLLEEPNVKNNENLNTFPSLLGEKIENLTARYNKKWFSL